MSDSSAPDGRVAVAHAMRAYLARTETFVYNQLKSLRRHRPVVVAHHYRRHLDYPFVGGMISQESLPRPTARFEWLAYSMFRTAMPAGNALLADYLREQRARLLHYHYVTDARFLLSLKRRTGLPAVVSAYGYDVSSFPREWYGLGRRYLRPVFERLDLFLAMSEDMRQDLIAIGCPEEKILVHYHGSDTSRFRFPGRSYEREKPLTILCCGALMERKGQHLVLEALKRIEPEARRTFRVVFVGDGPLRGKLHRITAEAGWEDRVIFKGHVPHLSNDLVEEYRRADLFVHPSLEVNGIKEGIPGAIVEAMAAGLPVVSTNHAGIPAAIMSGVNGILVAERDIDELAAMLQALLGDSSLRKRLGQAAADHARRELDIAACTRRLEDIYDQYM